MRKILLLIIAATSVSAFAQTADAPFVIKERGEAYESLQDAVDAIGGGAGTIVIAPGRYRQCAVQEAGRIAFVAAQAGTAIFDGGICEGKAALVLGGQSARVEGITFRNMRVPDRNGAGIRIEQGDLTVSYSAFQNSENGILSASDPSSTIRIEHSTFSGLGRCDGDYSCAHSIYVGGYGKLVVDRSRFERGAGGHYLKSRAAEIEVTDSSFDDSAGNETNYMIDLSEGATGLIARNAFVQGKSKDNYSAMIMVAAEEKTNSSDGLTITDNDAALALGVAWGTSFVADASGDRVEVSNNRLGPRIARFEKR